MKSGIRSGPASSYLQSQFDSRIQPKDLHRIVQTMNQKKVQASSNPEGLGVSETQCLIAEITKNNDQYRIKYKGVTPIMDCILYWDSSDIQFARRFCQVSFSVNLTVC